MEHHLDGYVLFDTFINGINHLPRDYHLKREIDTIDPMNVLHTLKGGKIW